MKAKVKNNRTENLIPFLYILGFAFIFRILLSFFGTLQLDQGTFIAWSSNLAANGLKSFYNGWSDYLPGYLYVLWVLGKINLLGIVPQTLLFKIPAICADVATGYLIYKIFQSNKKELLGVVGALIYLLNPAVFVNSSLWGQVDSLTALAVVSSIYFLDKYYILSAIILAVGTLIKPQAAFVLPVILFLFTKEKRRFRDLLLYCVTGLTVFILAFAPFSSGNLFQFIFDRLSFSANQYPYTSVNSFNFWGLTGFWKPDNPIFQFGSYFLVLVVTIFLSFKFKNKSKVFPYYITAFVFAASFFFFTRMHERHLLPLFAPLAIVTMDNPIFLLPYVGFSIIYILNLVYSYEWITNNFVQIYPDLLIKFWIAIGISLLIYVFYLIVKNKKTEWSKVLLLINRLVSNLKKQDVRQIKLPRLHLSEKTSKIILSIILVFAFATRIFNLGSPSNMYFDEVYHAFTAQTMLGSDAAKAWEWWNTPPEGFAYEWTHPPLAKLGMALGMLVFGQNSFGWRVPGALLGTCAVFLVYLIAKKIFNDEAIGLLSAGIFSLEGLPLVMSRIGMNDSYILFFSLLSIYLFFKQKDMFSAISFGLALASKWSALWVAPILFVLWIKRKPFKDSPLKIIKTFLCFSVLPFVIYLLAYLPMFTTGHTLETWWGMQKQMWWYHTGLVATHPYTSKWWSWPFMIRPVYMYTSNEIGNMVSRIYLIGNPLVCWFGIASMITCAIYAYLEKNKNLGLIVFSYLIFFVPWAASPRIMFLYHYLPSIPFMCIGIGYVLRRTPKLIYWLIPIFMLTFIYLYPHWTGINIPLWLDRSYYFITSWR